MSGRALRIPRRHRNAEGRCLRDRQNVGFEAADGGASLVYNFGIDLWAVRMLELDFGVESLTAS